jgi:hypothetical protein
MFEANEPRPRWTDDLIAFQRSADKLLETLQSNGRTKLSSEDYVHDILVSRLRDGEWAQRIDGVCPERLVGFDAFANRLDDQIESQENDA